MELGNGAVTSHQQATPDLGADLPYPDPQLIDLHHLVCTAHAFLYYSTSSPQSISESAAEGKQDGTFIASRLFASNLEWSPKPFGYFEIIVGIESFESGHT